MQTARIALRLMKQVSQNRMIIFVRIAAPKQATALNAAQKQSAMKVIARIANKQIFLRSVDQYLRFFFERVERIAANAARQGDINIR